ncbi:hypothetical protein L7A40_31430, partial [Achromobacter xylosoxidans]|nr:hypothetical protein [Achromobacter xylosoxidans]
RQYWAGLALGEQAATELLYREARSDQADTPLTTRVMLDPALSAALHRHAAPAEQLLMTAWGVLLQRLSANDNAALTLNWVHDCRDDYEELADCWGLFAKALPLPWQPAVERPFTQALATLQVLCEQAGEWQE